MKKYRFPYILNILLLLTLLLAGCNLPVSKPVVAPTINVTQAYQTVQAHLTLEASSKPPATSTPVSTTGVSATQTSTPLAATATLKPAQPSATHQVPAISCDQAAPGNPIDVTIPDNTKMKSGQTFTKTWRLQNAGTCTWTQQYSIAQFSGETMATSAIIPMPVSVAPGQTIDISVDMVAPLAAGTYRSDWKLRNAANTWFGIGPGGASTFWVIIVVEKSTTATVTGTVTPATPTSTSGPAPDILVSDRKTLTIGDTINLDSDEINGGAGDDLSYEINSNGKLRLVPTNGAQFGVFGGREPTLAECQATSLAQSVLPLDSLSRGTFLCYQTDDGRYGWLELGNLKDDQSLVVLFLTWAGT
jgi:hypothetical protein